MASRHKITLIEDGIEIEIEATVGELMECVRVLREQGMEIATEPQKKVDEYPTLTNNEIELSIKEKVDNINPDLIKEYIYRIENPGKEHTNADLMIGFFGKKIHSKDEQNAYISFYGKAKRARESIEKELKGGWAKHPDRSKPGNPTRFVFFLNDELPPQLKTSLLVDKESQ